MLNLSRILGSERARTGLGVGMLVFALGATGCGQRGPLYLPVEPAAVHRATLPQIIVPALPRDGNASQAEDDNAARAATPAAGGAR